MCIISMEIYRNMKCSHVKHKVKMNMKYIFEYEHINVYMWSLSTSQQNSYYSIDNR